MTISATSFRKSIRAFGSEVAYPDDVIDYFIALATLLLNVQAWGIGNVVPASPPTTMYDMASELFVAHYLVLEKRALDAANVGGAPGISTGVVSSKSTGPVSISYDTAALKIEDAAHWNLTVYGIRFYRLARMRAGPVQVGVGYAPLYSMGTAWSGPPVWPEWPGWV